MYIRLLSQWTVIKDAVCHPDEDWECVGMTSTDIDTLRDVWL